jgi:hypothetical protein
MTYTLKYVEVDSFGAFRLEQYEVYNAQGDTEGGFRLVFGDKVIAESGCGCCGYNLSPEEVRAMFAAMRESNED